MIIHTFAPSPTYLRVGWVDDVILDFFIPGLKKQVAAESNGVTRRLVMAASGELSVSFKADLKAVEGAAVTLVVLRDSLVRQPLETALRTKHMTPGEGSMAPAECRDHGSILSAATPSLRSGGTLTCDSRTLWLDPSPFLSLHSFGNAR
jgi:hypothetical protein